MKSASRGAMQAFIAGLTNILPTMPSTGITRGNSLSHPNEVRHATKSRKSAPGLKRKGVKWMRPPAPNTARQATKPCASHGYRGLPHSQSLRDRPKAPTLDQVRLLERTFNIKLHVRQGILCSPEGVVFDWDKAEKKFKREQDLIII
jgi:hypothetical protein